MKHLGWMLFILVVCLIIQNNYNRQQKFKGEAISNFLFHYHSMEIPPEEARYFQVMITTYDITIKDLEIFAK